MACHRCPNDNENECSWCCPDPIQKKKLKDKDNAELDAYYKTQKNKAIPIEFLCDAVRILEENNLLEKLPANIKKIYEEHRQEEKKEDINDLLAP